MILLLAGAAGVWYFSSRKTTRPASYEKVNMIQPLKAKELKLSFEPALLNKNKARVGPQKPASVEYYDHDFEISRKAAGNLYNTDRQALSSLDERGFGRDFFAAKDIPDLGLITIIMGNDLFNLTDYYYTSGVGMEIIHPVFSFLFTRNLLLPFSTESTDYYGFSLIQDLYTPYDIEDTRIQYGDRPFAAYLCLGFSKTSLFHEKTLRLRSQLHLGVIGPAALGSFSQDIFHSLEPAGWVNQVKNDIVINYNMSFTKGIVNDNNFELGTVASGRAGTLFTDISLGVTMRVGNGLSTFKYYTPLENKERKFRYDIFLNLSGRAKGYDATLQGGLFNRTSVHVIPDGNMERFLFVPSAGANLTYSIIHLRLEQLYSSPEFIGGKHHFFGRISLGISF
jgi:hypothetical protein